MWHACYRLCKRRSLATKELGTSNYKSIIGCLLLAGMTMSSCDSIVIDGLYAKYGALNYQFSFVSRDGGETVPFTVSAQAGAVKPTVKDAGLGDAIALTGADLWTDDQESSEGPLKDLVDGNASTYFHISWSNPSPFPHFIVFDL